MSTKITFMYWIALLFDALFVYNPTLFVEKWLENGALINSFVIVQQCYQGHSFQVYSTGKLEQIIISILACRSKILVCLLHFKQCLAGLFLVVSDIDGLRSYSYLGRMAKFINGANIFFTWSTCFMVWVEMHLRIIEVGCEVILGAVLIYTYFGNDSRKWRRNSLSSFLAIAAI